MTEETLNLIFRQIVLDGAFTGNRQINTYYFGDRDVNLDHQSFEATMTDYEGGYFWSREWVLKDGADPSTIRGEFPALFAESRVVKDPCPSEDELTFEIWFLLVDDIGCEGCPDHGERNVRIVKNNLRKMLKAYIRELLSYAQYEDLNDESGDPAGWISRGRVAAYPDEYADFDVIIDMMSIVEPDPIEYREWGRHPTRRAYYTRLFFTWCEDRTLTMNYDNPSVNKTGIVKPPC